MNQINTHKSEFAVWEKVNNDQSGFLSAVSRGHLYRLYAHVVQRITWLKRPDYNTSKLHFTLSISSRNLRNSLLFSLSALSPLLTRWNPLCVWTPVFTSSVHTRSAVFKKASQETCLARSQKNENSLLQHSWPTARAVKRNAGQAELRLKLTAAERIFGIFGVWNAGR